MKDIKGCQILEDGRKEKSFFLCALLKRPISKTIASARWLPPLFITPFLPFILPVLGMAAASAIASLWASYYPIFIPLTTSISLSRLS